MRFFRSSPPRIEPFQPELRVVRYVATRMDEPERGPQIRLNPADARVRLLVDGELAWVVGPRGQQLAAVVVDEGVREHECVLRDVPGVTLAEAVRVTKPDLDAPPRTRA